MTDEQLDKLHKLNTLRKDGIISEDEFEKQKRQILAPKAPVLISSDGKRVITPTSSSSKKLRNWVFGLGGTFIVFFLLLVATDKKKVPAESEEEAEVKVMSARDSLNALYTITSVFLRGSMKNPDSYDEVSHHEYFVEREAKDRKKKKFPRFRVLIRYRATNSFNAIITEEKLFNYDKDMKLINIEDR